MKINTSRKAGFTLVEIMIVVAIIGLLAAIAIPNFVKARNTSQANACINNMRQVDSATQQWALETGQSDAAVPSANAGAIALYIKGDAIPTCPQGQLIVLADLLTESPTCPNVVASPTHLLP